MRFSRSATALVLKLIKVYQILWALQAIDPIVEYFGLRWLKVVPVDSFSVRLILLVVSLLDALLDLSRNLHVIFALFCTATKLLDDRLN